MLVGGGLGSGGAFDEEVDLAGVVGFVFADVELRAEVVGWPPGPGLVDGHEPGIVAGFRVTGWGRATTTATEDADSLRE